MKTKIEDALRLGYIRIYRNLECWQWYTDVPCKVLYLHCILKANYVDKKWKSTIIKKGSFVTSLNHLALETGLTVRQTRTALEKLKKSENLTYKTTNKFTVINVCNYFDYQNAKNKNDTVSDKRATNKRQTSDKRTTTTNNVNNVNNVNNKREREREENFSKNLDNLEKSEKSEFEILLKYAEIKGIKNKVAYADKIKKSENFELVFEEIKAEIAKNAEKKQKKEAEKKDYIEKPLELTAEEKARIEEIKKRFKKCI